MSRVQPPPDRIRTTHVGSLPRPHALLDGLKARLRGELQDETAYAHLLARSVAEVVRRQVACGIDFVTDGEYSKPGFFTYVQERLEGFAPRPGARRGSFALEVRAFPEYYAEYFGHAMLGGTIVPMTPVACVGPIRYRGTPALERDLENVKAAAGAVGIPLERVFLPATAPSGVGANEYYASEEAYLEALAGALAQEYRGIIDAGLLLQIDDPGLSEVFSDPSLDGAAQRKRAQLYVEATNAALAGIPPARVRFHTCYGINEGPRIHEADLAQVIGFALQVNAALVSFEAANPRHEHEYHLFERLRLPEGKVLCPGVITHASNIVEHPELIAERLLRYAHLVGRDNVVAGADCGFSSQATYHTEVHPSVVWAKLEALAEGARRASARLWPKSTATAPLIGGMERQGIRIVDYDPTWPVKFETQRQIIARALGDAALRIEHIGSTSVPGLAAKPIIDILIAVENSVDEFNYLPQLEAAGYVLRVREPDWHEHRMLRTSAKDVHVHVYSAGCVEVERVLSFRDHLRTHAQDRRRYEETKRTLAQIDWPDMNAYADAKTEVIESILLSVGRDTDRT